MDRDHQAASELIRSMSSKAAADWLLERNDNRDCLLVGHRSWRKSDQKRLADRYLSNLPHASDRAYRAFLQFMSIPLFIETIKPHLPIDESRMDLLKYYLLPALKDRAKTPREKQAVAAFIAALG